MSRSAFALGLLVAACGAVAQTYPNKPIRLVLPYSAGTTTDVLGRLNFRFEFFLCKNFMNFYHSHLNHICGRTLYR